MHASVPNSLKNPNKPFSVWEVGCFPTFADCEPWRMGVAGNTDGLLVAHSWRQGRNNRQYHTEWRGLPIVG